MGRGLLRLDDRGGPRERPGPDRGGGGRADELAAVEIDRLVRNLGASDIRRAFDQHGSLEGWTPVGRRRLRTPTTPHYKRGGRCWPPAAAGGPFGPGCHGGSSRHTRRRMAPARPMSPAPARNSVAPSSRAGSPLSVCRPAHHHCPGRPPAQGHDVAFFHSQPDCRRPARAHRRCVKRCTDPGRAVVHGAASRDASAARCCGTLGNRDGRLRSDLDR